MVFLKEVWQTHRISKDALELAYDCTAYLRTTYIDDVNKQYTEQKINLDEYKKTLRVLESVFLPVTLGGSKRPTTAQRLHAQKTSSLIWNN